MKTVRTTFFALLFVLSSAMALHAQPKLAVSGPPTAWRGQNIAVTFTISATAGTNLSALQFTMPAGFTPTIPGTDGLPTAIGGKNLYCYAPSAICLAAGYVQSSGVTSNTLIPDGTLITVQIPVPSSAPVGPMLFHITNILGADASGDFVSFTGDSTFTVNILNPTCDLNGDGKVDGADVQIARDQALGTSPCGTSDLRQNGQCSVVDVQRIIFVIKGGTCLFGQ